MGQVVKRCSVSAERFRLLRSCVEFANSKSTLGHVFKMCQFIGFVLEKAFTLRKQKIGKDFILHGEHRWWIAEWFVSFAIVFCATFQNKILNDYYLITSKRSRQASQTSTFALSRPVVVQEMSSVYDAKNRSAILKSTVIVHEPFCI